MYTRTALYKCRSFVNEKNDILDNVYDRKEMATAFLNRVRLDAPEIRQNKSCKQTASDQLQKLARTT
jgi:hypothetical protein